MRHNQGSLALALALALVLVACGQSGGDTTTTAAAVTTTTAAAETTTTAGETTTTAGEGDVTFDVGVTEDTISVGLLADLSGPFAPLVQDIVADVSRGLSAARSNEASAKAALLVKADHHTAQARPARPQATNTHRQLE